MKVKQVMHKGAQAVTEDEPVRRIAEIMRQEDVGSVPVVKGQKLIGIVTDRDISLRGVADGLDITGMKARDVMSAEVISCRSDEECEDALRLMETNQIRRLPVLDGKDKLVGMLSLGDISHALPRDMGGEVLKAVSAHHA